MFEELQSTLRRFGRMRSIQVSVPNDADGYLDRQCPSKKCSFLFKVHSDDWKGISHDERAFCPSCGHSADSDKWATPRQTKYASSVVLKKAQAEINKALKADAARFNRQHSRSRFIPMTMDVSSRPRQTSLPPTATEPMRFKIICQHCTCRYTVIGVAYFCPTCGHNEVEQVFEQTIEGIKNTMNELDAIRASISDKHQAEVIVKSIIEHGLLDTVTAFQRMAEALFERLPSRPNARRNVFQNLSEGSSLWHEVTGRSYADYIPKNDLDYLQQVFQQRHLLAHRQGLVDADYIANSGDTRYREGQRIVVRPEDVTKAAEIVESLTSGMQSQIAHSRP